MAPVITALRQQARDPQRVAVHVDGEFACGAALEVVLAEGLRTGDAIAPDTLARIRAADERWRARHAALSLLAVRPRARRELADRLRTRNFAGEAVDWALAEADRLGLLDDTAFAEAWVRDRLRLRPRGSRALIAELTRKGVDRQVADDAVARVMGREDATDEELCRSAARKWLDTRARDADLDDDDERLRIRRRLAGFLQRRGYPPDAVRSALESF